MEYVSCRNWLHEISSPYKQDCFDCNRKLMREKKQPVAEEDLENFVHCNLDFPVHLFQIVSICDIFSILMLILLILNKVQHFSFT